MRPKDPGKTARMRRELREELKGKKTVVTIYIILRVLVILTIFRFRKKKEDDIKTV